MNDNTFRRDAIIIAGGRASRLGGIDKTALHYEGRSLLDLALDAVDGAESVAVIGRPRPGHARSNVVSVLEDPRFGGPVAAISAGLDVIAQEFPPDWTVVLAADLIRAPEAVAFILAALATADRTESVTARDGVIAVDDSGRRQPLLAVYRTRSLQYALDTLRKSGPLPGRSMRQLIAPLALRECPVPSELCRDIDTPADAEDHGISLDTPEPQGDPE
jgi:molybdopterin-guanine dinucleotide biosynthesis protein A